jgi:splicing factor 3B subunit 3
MLILGSDSGKVVILEYNELKNRFEKTHEETFGKTGCRRITPGKSILIQANI